MDNSLLTGLCGTSVRHLGSEENPCRVGHTTLPGARVVRLVHVSDTHMRHNHFLPDIPAGDVLIHSGDFGQLKATQFVFKETDYLHEINDINKFFGKLPHQHKIFVCGNHELNFEREKLSRTERLLSNGIYLQDSLVTIQGVRIYGSPWNGLRRSNARGFTAPYEHLHHYWDLIPDAGAGGVDILVTHSPPGGIMDQKIGSDPLKQAILHRIRPKAHLFGHAHNGHGVRHIDGVLFSNAAMKLCRGQANVIDVYLDPNDSCETDLTPEHYGNVDGAGKWCSIM